MTTWAFAWMAVGNIEFRMGWFILTMFVDVVIFALIASAMSSHRK